MTNFIFRPLSLENYGFESFFFQISVIFSVWCDKKFWRSDPKIVLKAPLAPVYTNFEAEREPKKKVIFCPTFSKKCPKTIFLTCFIFFKYASGTKFLVEVWKNCWKTARPSLEKILDPPRHKFIAWELEDAIRLQESAPQIRNKLITLLIKLL